MRQKRSLMKGIKVDVACIEPGRRDANRLKRDVKALCQVAVKEGAAKAKPLSFKKISFRDREERGGHIPEAERSLHWPIPLYPNDSLIEALE